MKLLLNSSTERFIKVMLLLLHNNKMEDILKRKERIVSCVNHEEKELFLEFAKGSRQTPGALSRKVLLDAADEWKRKIEERKNVISD